MPRRRQWRQEDVDAIGVGILDFGEFPSLRIRKLTSAFKFAAAPGSGNPGRRRALTVGYIAGNSLISSRIKCELSDSCRRQR